MTDPPLHLILAPLRGVTGVAYRDCLATHFGGLDGAVSPFLSTVAGTRIKSGHLADILPERNAALPLTPQVIGKSPAELRHLLLAIRALGYTACDLNAGCPWPFVVRKGRGAGLLRDAATLRAMLETGCEIMPGGFTLKARLGIDAPGLLLERMEIVNALPLASVTIHPRTARQMYGGTVDLDGFGACLAACRHPVHYNGDIRTPRDLERLRRAFPAVAGWMLGRGVVADPFLPPRCRGDRAPRSPRRLHAFLEEYTARARAELCGPAPLLGRLKELWSYLHTLCADGPRLWKAIRTSRRPEEYERVVADWFQHDATLVAPADGLPSAVPSIAAARLS